MKAIFTVFALVLIAVSSSSIQAQEKLIILVRHAEKADATSPDPELSEQGKERSQRLIKAIGKYRPGAFYSTDFKRTRDTLVPIASRRGKEIQKYDARKPQELYDAILKGSVKRVVVSGHSNTIPGLANLILKKDLFKNLDESEYTVIWKIRVENGIVKSAELLDY